MASGIIQQLAKYLLCDVKDIGDKLKVEMHHKAAKSYLRRVKLTAKHHSDGRRIRIHGLTQHVNSKSCFAFHGRKNITVDQHFYSKYGKNLRFPYLPLAIHIQHGERYYYPLEQLVLDYEGYNLGCDKCTDGCVHCIPLEFPFYGCYQCFNGCPSCNYELQTPTPYTYFPRTSTPEDSSFDYPPPSLSPIPSVAM